MKKFLKDFCKRGMAFAWGGPVIMAIIWLCLQASGTVSELTVNQVALGIFSTTIMAFIAAGISVVYQMENLPKPFAVLIQASVLYIDYMGIYLLNGWLEWGITPILVFSFIFLLGYLAVWVFIYSVTKKNTARVNEVLKQKQRQ